MTGISVQSSMLVPDEDYEQVVFTDTEFDTPAAGGCHFLDCTFDNSTFGQIKMRKCRFTDSRIRDTRFVATDLAETGWQDVALSSCGLAGVQAFGVALRRVAFRDCKLDSVNFRDSTFDDVRFENCLLRDVDFGSARLTGVTFGGCTLGADFTKTTLSRVDLRGAELGITAGYDALRGATIDTIQLIGLAPLLAQHLGITVED
jgi:uncharacterized protein YjbI with pentapeptide repeats